MSSTQNINFCNFEPQLIFDCDAAPATPSLPARVRWLSALPLPHAYRPRRRSQSSTSPRASLNLGINIDSIPQLSLGPTVYFEKM